MADETQTQYSDVPAGYEVLPPAGAAPPASQKYSDVPDGYEVLPPAPKPDAAPAPAPPAAQPKAPWSLRSLLDFPMGHLPGDRGDLSDIPAPLPKTDHSAGTPLNDQELADQEPPPPHAHGATVFDQMDQRQREINRALPPMGMPPPTPILSGHGTPMSEAEREFNAEPGVRDRSEFVVRQKPAPSSLDMQVIQQAGANEPIENSPTLKPAEPVRLGVPQPAPAPVVPITSRKQEDLERYRAQALEDAPGMLGTAISKADTPATRDRANRIHQALTHAQSIDEINRIMRENSGHLMQTGSELGRQTFEAPLVRAEDVNPQTLEYIAAHSKVPVPVLRGTINFAGGVGSPESLAQLYIAGGLGGRAVSSAFAALGFYGSAKAAREAWKNHVAGNDDLSEEQATEAALNAGMGILALAHAADFRKYSGAYGEKGVKVGGDKVGAQVGYRPAYREPGPEGSYSEEEGSRVVPGKPTASVTVAGRRMGTGGPEAPVAESLPNLSKAEPKELTAGQPGENVPRGTSEEPLPIGAVEPETGRPVLHEGETPAEIQAAATAEHPEIKTALSDLVSKVPGAKLAGARDEKDADRLAEKIEDEGQSPQTARDYSGFRIAVDTPQAAIEVANALKQRFEVHAEQNNFDKGDEENGFHGHTLNVREPGSDVSHEVQILPKEVAEAADTDHAIYEKARDGDKEAQAQLRQKNDENWQRFQARQKGGNEPETKQPTRYEYGNTQSNIPDDSPAAKALDTFRQSIPEDQLAGDGKDVGAGGNHVTVRYGLKGDDTSSVEAFLAQQKPFTARLGPIEVFPPSRNSNGAAVLVARIEAPELARMNAEIEQHGDFAKSDFPDYKPHATIAYVDPAVADQYKDRTDLVGAEFPVDSVSISDRNGKQIDVPLKGEAGAVQKPGPSSVVQRAQGGTGGEGSGRGRVEPVEQRTGAPEEKSQGSIQRDVGAAAPEAGTVGQIATADLHFDPKRFQYKLNTDAGGTTNLLKGQRWNPDLAGVISIWRDPADGLMYVVNGHHRAQLARESGVEKLNALHLPAETAEEARATAALQNIAEGRGTPVDAAKFFRDTGLTAADLKEKGISLGEATAANGLALSRLDQSLFDRVVNGQMRIGRAIAIGNATEVPEQQEALLKLIQRAEMRGKRVTDDTVDELARMVKGSGEHVDTQQTLFGAVEMRRNLALEKAEISAYIREEIGKDKRLFSTVADQGRATRLERGGNKIDAAKNAETAKEAVEAQELYDKLSTRTGAVDDILNKAAGELAAGKGNANEIKRSAYEATRKALSEAFRGGEKPSASGREPLPGSVAGAEQKAVQRGDGAAERRNAGSAAAESRPVAKGDVVQLADGRAGVVQYVTPAVNGALPRARVRLADGTMRETVKPQDMKRVTAPEPARDTPWIGVDVDKTLAHYTEFKGPEVIGKPLAPMVERVKDILANGETVDGKLVKDVRIFTARVDNDSTGIARASIEAWSLQHLGQILPITNVKDPHMVKLYDDRAAAVEPNTGKVIGEANAEAQQTRAVAPPRREEAAPSDTGRRDANAAVAQGGLPEGTAGARGEGGQEPVRPEAAGTDRGDGSRGTAADVPAQSRSAGAGERPSDRGETSAQTQERLVARGRFQKELKAAEGRLTWENAAKATVTTIEAHGSPLQVLNAAGYEAVRKIAFPDEQFIAAFLDRAAASKVIARIRAAESNLRPRPGMRAAADALKTLALKLDSGREPDGSVVILRGDYDEPTVREELWHRWQSRRGLLGSEVLRSAADRLDFESAIDELKAIGYGDLNVDELAAEAMAKALAGDPDWKVPLAARQDLARTFLEAVAAEHGRSALNDLPPVDPEIQSVVDEARANGGDQGTGAGSAVRGVGQADRQGLRSEGWNEGRTPGEAGGRERADAGGSETSEPGRPSQAELRAAGQSELFKRASQKRLNALRGEPVPFPGMEDLVEEREKALAAAEREAMEEQLRSPLGNIDSRAGEMEQRSPLFQGTEANPQRSLFKKTAPERVPTSVTTGKHNTGKSLEDAVDELKELPKRKMPISERVELGSDKALEAMHEGATGIQKAFAAVKGTAVGAWDSWAAPAPWTDYLESLGDLKKAELKAAMDVKAYQKELVRVAPSEREREAITVYGEAPDDMTLRKWADMAVHLKDKPGGKRYWHAFQDALNLTPEQKKIAQVQRNYYNQQLKILTDAGLLPAGANHYVMHMFSTDPETLAKLTSVTDFTELSPNPSFLNRRVYKSYFEAIEQGENPKTMDAGKILSAYHDAFTKAFMTRGFIRSLLYGNDPEDGRPLAILQSRAGWVVVDKSTDGETRILKQPRRPEKIEDYVHIPASQLRNFTWELTDEDREVLVPGYNKMDPEEQAKLFGPDDPHFTVPKDKVLALKGNILIHPKYSGRVSDLVTKSWFDSDSDHLPVRVTKAVLKGVGKAGSKVKSLILYGSGFHQVQLGIHAIDHWISPFKLPELKELARDPEVQDGVGHGLGVTEIDPEGVLSSLTGMGSYHQYLFGDWIPRLKMKSYKIIKERNTKVYGGGNGKAPKMTRDEIALMSAQQTNAAFSGLTPGFFRHLNFMNNRTYKAVEHMVLFSPDFTKARMGFVAQGFSRFGHEQRMALVRGAVMMYAMARIANMVLNHDKGIKGGHWNPEDAFTVVTPKSWGPNWGNKAISMRTVYGDVARLIEDPKAWAYNRLNPVTLRPTIEFLTGRDNFGRKETSAHFFKEYGKQVIPIPGQKLVSTSDEGLIEGFFTAFGANMANYRTPLEKYARKLRIEAIPDKPEDEEKMAESRRNTKLVEAIRDGRASTTDLWNLVNKGQLTAREAANINERAGMTELQYDVSHMQDFDDALKVWDKADKDEKAEIAGVLEAKAERRIENIGRDNPFAAEELEAKLTKLGVLKPVGQ